MAFGTNIWHYNTLQYRPIISCGSGIYGDAIWFPNSLRFREPRFDLGTYSGVITIDWLYQTGAASLAVRYGATTYTISSITNTNGSATYSYVYDASIGNLIFVTMDSRSNSAVTQHFKVKSSCPVIPPTTTTTTTTSTTTTTTTTTGYTINWTYIRNTSGGLFEVFVNSINVVSETSTNSGSISVSAGDLVYITVNTQTLSTPETCLSVDDNGSNIYGTCLGTADITFGTYVVSGNGTIVATSNDF